jgi:hypothetical protein
MLNQIGTYVQFASIIVYIFTVFGVYKLLTITDGSSPNCKACFNAHIIVY